MSSAPKYDEKYDVAAGASVLRAIADDPQVVAGEGECERRDSNPDGVTHQLLRPAERPTTTSEPVATYKEGAAGGATATESTTKSATTAGEEDGEPPSRGTTAAFVLIDRQRQLLKSGLRAVMKQNRAVATLREALIHAKTVILQSEDAPYRDEMIGEIDRALAETGGLP